MTLEQMKREDSIPVVIVNSLGIITYVNGAFEDAMGWESPAILGRSLTLIIPEYLRDAHNLGFSRFLTTEQPTLLEHPIQLKAVDRNGREFVAEHFIIAEKVDGEWCFGATIKELDGEERSGAGN